ncbi:uncharacterized protein LOC106130154 [Amyelois transitella]|uniref:uncharacterized protein LOC106130154 n=1 Tax=Amyelois transitella TaxID=680683 RepID=UPI002990494E|nr:uncharacterized protein LOC106130154 [Amyelois transitella]
MARNAEKAMTTLARWRAAQVQEAGGQRERRPYLASECNDLPQAEKWRLQIVREIAKKVAQIQNEMDSEAKSPSIVSGNRNEEPVSSIRSPSLRSAHASPGSPLQSTSRTSPGKTSLKSDKMSISSRQKSQEMSHIGSLSKQLSDHVDELTSSVNMLTKDGSPQSPVLGRNIEKIATMGEILTNEANALRTSIKSLSDDIAKTKMQMNCCDKTEDVNFPYHLFLVEIVVNKIHMKCECFDVDLNNLVITATFLGKQPIVLLDSSLGKVENLAKLNAGKSTLFAMTYDKICAIKEFEIFLQLTKQPPCSSCVTKIAETRLDFTSEFVNLREELCKKWTEEQPNDNILCTTSTPLTKNLYYLSCGSNSSGESIGVIEVTVRMSFLGKEITTAFCAAPKTHGASFLLKQDNGMAMYSCQKVEMDDMGKVLLDEDVMSKKRKPHQARRCDSPESQLSSVMSSKSCDPQSPYASYAYPKPKYDEIFTKVNANELKIRVPKTSKVERVGKYERIQELCSCESTPHNNNGEQIQFEMPADCKNNTYSSNLKYTYKGCDKTPDRYAKEKVINVTPSNCPVPVNCEKILHPLKDVFILKIGKKMETSDKKTDLEIELVTPKAIQEKTVDNSNTAQQCSSLDLKKLSKTSKKGKGKKNEKKGKGTGLGEFRIRDLNDEINKLMREKRHWEVQIKALGGPDHARVGPKMLDQDGKEVPGNRGYKYFGAAKDLPGVRELFSQEPPPPPRRTRADLMRDVDADYYGYRDDDDGLLLPLEQQAEKEAIARAVDEWKRNKEQNKNQDLPEEENIYPEDPDDKRIEDDEAEVSRSTSHVAVPSQKDIEEALLRRKKQELLEKYGCLDVKLEGS